MKFDSVPYVAVTSLAVKVVTASEIENVIVEASAVFEVTVTGEGLMVTTGAVESTVMVAVLAIDRFPALSTE